MEEELYNKKDSFDLLERQNTQFNSEQYKYLYIYEYLNNHICCQFWLL